MDEQERGLNLRRAILPIILHMLTAVLVFIVGYYGFAFLAIGAAIAKCGAETDYTLALKTTGERVGAIDSACDWTSPGHTVQIYHAGAHNAPGEVLVHYATNSFHVPRASWSSQGALIIEAPGVKSLSIAPNTLSGMVVKFGHMP